MAPVEILTARLRLRPRTVDDVEANLTMDLDPEVHRYIFVHGVPDAGTWRQRLIQRIESGWPVPGGIWVVEWRHRPGFLGWCGLFPLEESGLIELGYRYVRAAWGRGIATEAAGAVLEHGFKALRLDPIVAVAHPDNLASRRVLEKLGFHGQGRRRYYGTEVAYYRFDRSRHLAAAPGTPRAAATAAGSERD